MYMTRVVFELQPYYMYLHRKIKWLSAPIVVVKPFHAKCEELWHSKYMFW